MLHGNESEVNMDNDSVTCSSSHQYMSINSKNDEKLSAKDAKAYAKAMNDNAMFQVCALCGEEGPSNGSVSVEESRQLLQETDIESLYQNYTKCLLDEENYNQYEVAYAKILEYHLPGGLLRDEKNICKQCIQYIHKKRKKRKQKTQIKTVKKVRHNFPKMH